MTYKIMKQNAVIVSKSSSVHYDTVSSEIPYLILVPVAKTLIQHTDIVQTKAKITRIRKEENQPGVNVFRTFGPCPSNLGTICQEERFYSRKGFHLWPLILLILQSYTAMHSKTFRCILFLECVFIFDKNRS